MSILTGPEIRRQIQSGIIEIDPYDENRVQPNSVDLTLGRVVRVYTGVTGIDMESGEPFNNSAAVSSHIRSHSNILLDTRRKNSTIEMAMDESGWVVMPGVLYLMHTAERIHTKKFVTQLNGKSSLARLGIVVHLTAAYGDTGFNGQYTLEVTSIHPVKLYPGMAIAQAVFYTCEGEIEDYSQKGHYVGAAANGAEASHSWEQFK